MIDDPCAAVMSGPDALWRARHAVLAAGYGGRPDPADPAQVLAMPMVLHIPKADPPLRSSLLEAAASAAVALCLDERVGLAEDGEPGPWRGNFTAWVSGRIRKVSRRARGAQWLAAQDVAGITVEVGGAQARALVPGPVGELDPRIKKMQIGGTDLEHDNPGPPIPGLPVLWIDPALEMTVGKASAQVGHASMLLAAAMSDEEAWRWAQTGFRCSVRDADPAQWADAVARLSSDAVAVRDAGYTEVAPGSMTVIAVPG
ncbi:peptidyl-tRNA hydrolase [Rhodococcus sp. AD45-ID]|uniref:peptidyl-tRNA hydrolase n=1 Tax=unclassified Rhodococcus (in: high G+C Gram-positive bacteria) TaxID=192944 RepID=UPI0005DB9B51|nr:MULTISPECIES: peptidyl-tRNA hydrolase [unclassified Rhodococcus (in: high G+C Gram-positive bacteria)]KJF20005.1 peptidyl-tRNA hydrolase [Rhodococcus sp. AD45]PSR41126.1 peptidyl-tRNA hydrolase [Rhodococcus sp. AD45-ID]